MRSKFFLGASLFVLLGATSAEKTTFPGPLGSDPWENRPNDPSYSSMWQLFSHVPKDQRGDINVSEQGWGSGMHVDRAWQLHTGTPQVVIAILDSGINWDNNDLIDRHFLNTKELPLPEHSESYDQNGDGRISISDDHTDSRVYDANSNGALDAGDLIKVFSNGIDEDANGYTDDIAGWDFHELDNDPSDRTKFGHGTGEARDSVAALNNGISGTGVCGNCTFIALRLNDSFIVDSNAFAQAVIYAVDMEASLVQQALGGVNHSELTKEAVNYAYDNDVVIIGSAADENSFHHNYPSTLDPVVYTNAIRYDTRDFRDATTFLNFNNCSNYGARVDVATSGRSCSSEATGNLSGISALAISYGRSLGKNLTAGQLISLIKTSANDINFGPMPADSDRHSTYEGWDTITGYGRTNAFSMLKRIKNNQIPPEARILSPEWFAFERFKASSSVTITASARDVREVTIDIYRGVETALPAKKLVNKVAAKVANNKNGEYSAVIPHRTLASLSIHPNEPERYHDAYTAVLTTTGNNGIKAEARRTFFVHQDDALNVGFPQNLRGSGESSGLFVDLDQDGKDEFVTADGSGYLHAFKVGGRAAVGFPVQMPLSNYQGPSVSNYASVFAPIAAGDIDNDSRPDIVVATLEGQVIAFDHTGKIKDGFPVSTVAPDWSLVNKAEPLALGSMASPVIADLTGDGTSEIIVPSMNGRLYVFNADGSDTVGFPVTIVAEGKMARLMSSPAIYDIDGDGTKDFIMGSNHTGDATGYLFAINGRGTLAANPYFSGFPARVPLIKDAVLPTVGTGIPTSPAIADFDGDGSPEILIHAFVGKPYLFAMNGAIKKSLSIRVSGRHETNDEFMLAAFGHPTPIDILGRGYPQPTSVGVGQRMLASLLLGGKRLDYNHMLGAWDPISGNMISGYPKSHDDMILAGSAVAIDTNNNGQMEMAVGSGGYYLRIKGADGVDLKHFTGGWIFGAPALGDIDGDGFLDLAATTREGHVFVWRTTARKTPTVPSQIWSTFKGNNQRTGTQL